MEANSLTETNGHENDAFRDVWSRGWLDPLPCMLMSDCSDSRENLEPPAISYLL